MKKSDLVIGKHILECKGGNMYLLTKNYLARLGEDGWINISDYDENLRLIDVNGMWDIVRIYEITEDLILSLVWERKEESLQLKKLKELEERQIVLTKMQQKVADEIAELAKEIE